MEQSSLSNKLSHGRIRDRVYEYITQNLLKEAHDTAAVLSKRLIAVWVPSLCENTAKHKWDRTARGNWTIKCIAFPRRRHTIMYGWWNKGGVVLLIKNMSKSTGMYTDY